MFYSQSIVNALEKFLCWVALTLILVVAAPAVAAGVEQRPLGSAPRENSSELVVYFHAFGGETQEPYIQPMKGAAIIDGVKQIFPGSGFLSLDYDPSDAVAGNFKSVDQTLEAYIKDFPNIASIRLCGTSFGAYTALSYYASASEEIRSLIKGIVAVETPDDLEVLAQNSADKNLRQFLSKESLNSNNPKYLKNRSLSQIYKLVKQPSSVYLLMAKSDIIVPSACNKNLQSSLNARGFAVSLEKIDEGHGFPSIHYYEQGFRFTDQSEKRAKSLN